MYHRIRRLRFFTTADDGDGRAYLGGPRGGVVIRSRFDADSCGYIPDPVRRLFGLCGLNSAFHHDSWRVLLPRLQSYRPCHACE